MKVHDQVVHEISAEQLDALGIVITLAAQHCDRLQLWVDDAANASHPHLEKIRQALKISDRATMAVIQLEARLTGRVS